MDINSSAPSISPVNQHTKRKDNKSPDTLFSGQALSSPILPLPYKSLAPSSLIDYTKAAKCQNGNHLGKKTIQLEEHGDNRGTLVALEQMKNVPFEVKRVYYMYDTGNGVRRGFHAHKNLKQMLICVHGSNFSPWINHWLLYTSK